MTQLFTNNVDTALAADLLIGGTTMTVADASNLTEPTGDEFQLVTLTGGGLYEIVRMDSRAAAVLTIVRAQEGTAAQAWPSGTRVFAGVTAGALEGLQPTAGDSFVESLNPGATPLGTDAINIQSTRGSAISVASGDNSTCIGNRTRASGVRGIALGFASKADADDAIAIGSYSEATASEAVAIGGGSALHEATFNIGALPAAMPSDYAYGDAFAFQGGGGTMESVVLSDPVDLKTTATITCPLPAGIAFYADEVGIIVESANTVTVQPEISFGVTGDNAKLLAAVTATGLDAVKNRQRFATLLSAHGETSYTFTVNTGATATTLTGRAYWRGFAVQDAPA